MTTGGQTPGSVASGSLGPHGLRDGLMLNQGEEDEEMHPKLKRARQTMQIQSQLKSLPAPSNEVEIQMPELEDQDIDGEAALEEDAADLDKRREQQEQARLEIERKKRSKAVQRDLPRPVAPHLIFRDAEDEAAASTGLSAAVRAAEDLVFEEMVALASHDAVHHPMKGARPPKKAPAIDDFSLSDLKAAEQLVADEAASIVAAVGGYDIIEACLAQAMEERTVDYSFNPQAKKYQDWRSISQSDQLEAAKHTFTLVEAQLQKDAKRAKKLEDKLQKLLGGYMNKVQGSIKKMSSLAEERETLLVETGVFRTLAAQETSSLKSRPRDIEELVEQEKARNVRLQARFKQMKRLAVDLDEKLQ